MKIIDHKGKIIIDQQCIANYFNQYFVEIGLKTDKKISHHFHDYLKDINCKNTFFVMAVRTHEIQEIILTFDSNKSTGPNSIPIYILKAFNNFFSSILCKIINLVFETGIFPDLCKLAKVIPINKKDDALLCENYRPISLLSIFSKIFEKLIYGRMYKFLDVNNLIYNRRFGFRTNYSTEHALISLTENIKNLLDSGNVVCGVFIDLEKAFDMVKHNILCEKLPYYGFRGKIEVLIKSYLSNRKQLVSINGFESVNLDITCGVPQGSNLRPILLILYINDFRFSLGKATSTHFADDTCILHFSNKLKTVETELNKDLKHASTWLNANRLSLNVSKSKLLIFQSKYKNIDYSKTSIKLNGIRLLPSDMLSILAYLLTTISHGIIIQFN